jgi:pimeloyl-ACP methyl ester carboxylesterase
MVVALVEHGDQLDTEARGVTRIVLVGHSFGGAVVIEGGVRASTVAGVVTLAPATTVADGARVTPTGASVAVAGRTWQRVALASGGSGWMDVSLISAS